MSLINTATLDLDEFHGKEIPLYAILSHRWGEEEVSFQELEKGNSSPGPGLTKIKKFCEVAAADGLEWVWIDTCCIDKRSSAELSEAINSMFKWYAGAYRCYAQLSDFYMARECPYCEDRTCWSCWHMDEAEGQARFWKSSWITRGWTLQELLAPREVQLLDADWEEVGDRRSLSSDIAHATGIDRQSLLMNEMYIGNGLSRSTSKNSIAKIMSWASRRSVTREEDIAYCLLGLFEVNMPLLYGEGGESAFKRLQIEILAKSHDESLFAWTDQASKPSGIFADSPKRFANSGDILTSLRGNEEIMRPPCAITNRGLEIAIPDSLPGKNDAFPLCLNCFRASNRGRPKAICIQIRLRNRIAFRTRTHLMNPEDFPEPYERTTLRTLSNSFKTPVIYTSLFQANHRQERKLCCAP